jgi:hypothetical protein
MDNCLTALGDLDGGGMDGVTHQQKNNREQQLFHVNNLLLSGSDDLKQ